MRLDPDKQRQTAGSEMGKEDRKKQEQNDANMAENEED